MKIAHVFLLVGILALPIKALAVTPIEEIVAGFPKTDAVSEKKYYNPLFSICPSGDGGSTQVEGVTAEGNHSYQFKRDTYYAALATTNPEEKPRLIHSEVFERIDGGDWRKMGSKSCLNVAPGAKNTASIISEETGVSFVSFGIVPNTQETDGEPQPLQTESEPATQNNVQQASVEQETVSPVEQPTTTTNTSTPIKSTETNASENSPVEEPVAQAPSQSVPSIAFASRSEVSSQPVVNQVKGDRDENKEPSTIPFVVGAAIAGVGSLAAYKFKKRKKYDI